MTEGVTKLEYSNIIGHNVWCATQFNSGSNNHKVCTRQDVLEWCCVLGKEKKKHLRFPRLDILTSSIQFTPNNHLI